MAVNLLKETLEILEKHGKSPRDVKWVGSKDGKYAITWDEFKKIGSFLYNPYNPINIAYDLVVVGEDWWLERYVRDETEGWSFKMLPVKEPNAKRFKHVLFHPPKSGWNLEDCNPVRGGNK